MFRITHRLTYWVCTCHPGVQMYFLMWLPSGTPQLKLVWSWWCHSIVSSALWHLLSTVTVSSRWMFPVNHLGKTWNSIKIISCMVHNFPWETLVLFSYLPFSWAYRYFLGIAKTQLCLLNCLPDHFCCSTNSLKWKSDTRSLYSSETGNTQQMISVAPLRLEERS